MWKRSKYLNLHFNSLMSDKIFTLKSVTHKLSQHLAVISKFLTPEWWYKANSILMTHKYYAPPYKLSPRRPGDLDLCITEWSNFNAVCWCYMDACIFSYISHRVCDVGGSASSAGIFWIRHRMLESGIENIHRNYPLICFYFLIGSRQKESCK